MTDVRERLARIICYWSEPSSCHDACCIGACMAKRPDECWWKAADAILAALPELTPPSGNEAVEAARRIVAARGIDWKMPEGDWIEKDGYICARYILSLAPGKDVVEGARDVVRQYHNPNTVIGDEWLASLIAAFATACVAREREACAKIAEGRRLNEQGGVWCDEDRYRVQEGEAIAECIRAGGSK